MLTDYDKIEIEPLKSAVEKFQPDLIVIVDAMNFKRCTRQDADEVSKIVRDKAIKLAIIDHHEPVGIENNDVYINQGSPAAVQDVYEILFSRLDLKKPAGYAQTTMLGLYSDSGGFVYENKRHEATFKLASELIDAGAKIEAISSLINSYSEDMVHAIGELASNARHKDDYTFSFISDDFTSKWVSDGKNFDELKVGVAHFANQYIRSVDGRQWGFVVYKDIAAGDDTYGVSLRALGGTKNVAEIATALGGGGHIAAAGVKIKSNSLEEVLKTIQLQIEQMK